MLHKVPGGLKSAALPGFDLGATLACGQCFRWRPAGAGSFDGVAGGWRVTARMDGDCLYLIGAPPESAPFWIRYFDLERDYDMLYALLIGHPALERAREACPGLRILRQQPFEALCSFILSANNNIPRIQGIVERLCAAFGAPLPNGGFAFPVPERLAALTPADLAFLRAGYRVPYLLDAARRVAEGSLDLDAAASLPLADARAALMAVKGVGPKVADCVLLYGLGRMDAFPTDVWIRRVMAEHFPDGLPAAAMPAAGLAQQVLFHWARRPEARNKRPEAKDGKSGRVPRGIAG